jgi:hypothetical protein
MLLAQMLQQVAPGAALRRPPAMAYEQPEEVQRLRSQDPDFLRISLTPLDDEQGQLDKQMQLANALMQGSGRQYASPFGAAIGGLSDVIRMGVGAHRMGNLEKKQQGLNTRRQEMIDAAGRGPSTARLQKALGIDPNVLDLRERAQTLAEQREGRLAGDVDARETRLGGQFEFKKGQAQKGAATAAEKAKKKADEDLRKTEAGFRKEILQSEQGKKYMESKTQVLTLSSLAKNPTPANSMAIVFAAMKSLDPDSVVKEGEQVQVRNTTNLPGQLLNYFTKVTEGVPLNPQQVSEIVDMAQRGLHARAQALSEMSDAYKPIVEGAGGSMKNVMPLHLNLEEPVTNNAPAQTKPQSQSIQQKLDLPDGRTVIIYSDGRKVVRTPTEKKE